MKINILKESVPLRYLFMEFAPLQLHVFEMANLLIRLDSELIKITMKHIQTIKVIKKLLMNKFNY